MPRRRTPAQRAAHLARQEKKFARLANTFFSTVGNCVAEWANAEDDLFRICELCLGCPRRLVAIVYFRTPSFDGRLSLTSELIKAVIPADTGKNDLKIWTDLEKDIRELTPIRNCMVHQPVTFWQPEKEHLSETIGPGTHFEIAVRSFERARKRKLKVESLRQNDLEEHGRAVVAVNARLLSFYSEILSQYV